MSNTVSDQIKKALALNGKPQRHLADFLGKSTRTIQKKLKDNRWSIQEINRISEEYQCKINLDGQPEGIIRPRKKPIKSMKLSVEFEFENIDISEANEFMEKLQKASLKFRKEQESDLD